MKTMSFQVSQDTSPSKWLLFLAKVQVHGQMILVFNFQIKHVSLQIIVLLLKREQNTNTNPMSNFLASSNFKRSRPNTMICFYDSPVRLKHLL